MNTATFIRTTTNGGVTQTTYELSGPMTFKRWTGEKRKTMHVIVSHAQYGGVDETAVFPGTHDSKVTSYADLFMTNPTCDDETALSALGLTIIDPVA